MIALSITDIKQFMHQLLLTDAFDHFRVPEACITTFSTFRIDGRLQKDYYTKEELEEVNADSELSASWSQLRPLCFQLIRGKKTPLNLKIVFRLPSNHLERLLSQKDLGYTQADVDGLFLNIRYDGASLSCITGTAMRLFTLDKSLEQEWDKTVQKFFSDLNISFS